MDIKKTSFLRNVIGGDSVSKVHETPKGKDRFISSHSMKNLDPNFVKYYNLVSQSSDIRLDKVESIKQKLKENQYQSQEIQSLAEKILRFYS